MAVTTNLRGKILEHMLQIRSMEEEQRIYFHFDSELWRAIKDYFGKTKPAKNVFVKTAFRDGRFATRDIDSIGPVVWNYGTGPSVDLASVRLWTPFNKRKRAFENADKSVLVMEASTEFRCSKDDENSFRQSVYIDAPAFLEKDFSKKAFRKWISGLEKDMAEEERKEDMADIRRLRRKYQGAF